MDGENNGKPYEQMDDLGGPPLLETPMSMIKLVLVTIIDITADAVVPAAVVVLKDAHQYRISGMVISKK